MSVNTIYQMGDDALNNQATCIISPLAQWDLTEALQLRISTFSAPEYKIEFYDISYKGHTISRVKPGNTTEKSLDIVFRVDKYYNIYKMLRNWGKMVHDHNLDDVGTGDVPTSRTDIMIQTPTGTTWTFTGCMYENLSNIEFDQTAEGEPITATLTVRYLESDCV